ncbi:RNA-binding protein [Methylobacterium sp. J-068]|uniref:RNA-binding protein n=1 Tax=Methylobacterium sp. J-068 TaxID=2836649 RepID=UPI001FB8DB98|nr:RNA-binding protein [Methylobacterium sp. J-068]MCJ2036595.1 RNA-binding protein [Methylobacterium sp. J-068]
MTGETADPNPEAAEPDPSTLLDSGLGRGRANALRTCLVTRVSQAPGGMIRFVLGPDGAVVPDLRARLPGRGAWLTPTRAVLNEAVKRRAFQRAFKTKEAAAPADLADRVAEGLRADLRQSLSLANKAGCVVAGFAKVESAIGDKAGVAAVIQASDGSADGRRKIVAALHRRHGSAISCIPVIDDLSNTELDMALGRDHVIHAALVAGVGASGCLARWRRLRSFEGLATTAEEAGPVRDGQAAFDLHDD